MREITPEDRIRKRMQSHAISLALVMAAVSCAVWAYNHPPEPSTVPGGTVEVVTTEFADATPPAHFRSNTPEQSLRNRAALIKEHIRKGEYGPADFVKEFHDRPGLERLVKE